ncbi:uroporphyrinogen decarboxylase family protein [Sporomusa sp.]|uniref:uroporphyrinogen decarboxylase family protein n=1 Tax=Sporomusa sp. TaxID=2078658 RepID=UPI002C057B07|nr:uroporphyrinogen decarboxylase family protein [Sporomusa sp.]HWR08700.1 uroporphyrinogen decarboxylase family protein [Sporomusa sp.]
MKTSEELLQERTVRIKKAIALEKPDKTPVVLSGDAFAAKHMGVKLSDYISTLERSNEIILKSCKELGDIDGTGVAFTAARGFALGFCSKVKLPGRELPDDALWQLDEQEMMSVEDYNTILAKGWAAFSEQYFTQRLELPLASIIDEMKVAPQMGKNVEEAGYVFYNPCGAITVNEFLGGGRSFPKFMKDLFKTPDKVAAVLDVIQAETMTTLRKQIQEAKPLAVFISPARGASQFFSSKLWERFVWKYLKATVEAVIEEGAIANLHIDGDWERDLEYFKALPRGKCVFETDSCTNIYKIKEVLGSHMCIKGDVPAGLLTLGTPDKVYEYCIKLINDMGTGFILSSGCTVPPNAKVENVKAMISAASGK